MGKNTLNVYAVKEEQNRLSHAMLEQKGNANRNPEMPRFGSCSFRRVTCQLPKQEGFLKGA